MERFLVLLWLLASFCLAAASTDPYPSCYHANVTYPTTNMIGAPQKADTPTACQGVCADFIDKGCSHFSWYSGKNLCTIFDHPTAERDCTSACISATLGCGNMCFLKETGSPTANTAFKGVKGQAKTVYCENLSTSNGPCYIKNSDYQKGWLIIDPTENFVIDCYNRTRPDLKPLKDGKCGFDISRVDDEHAGKWICGNINADQSSVDVVSQATLMICAQQSCPSMVEFGDMCGCFSFKGSDSLSWTNARTECQKMNGDLVTLDSLSKQTTIFEHWDELDIWVNPWIGAHKDGGEWKWASNGQTIPDGESDDPFGNWDWGQPDYGDCAYMSKLGYGAWSSDDCQYGGPFICEIN